MSKKNYYEILKVSPLASYSAIKKSYQNLIRQYHPDKNPGDPSAVQTFKKITEAYEILSDSFKRKTFDQQRKKEELQKQKERSKPAPLYESFNTYRAFHFNESVAPSIKTFPENAKDFMPLKITLEEAAFGCKKDVIHNNQKCFVQIPSGTEDGQKLRIQSLKQKSVKNSFVRIFFKEHSLFFKQDKDIFMDLPVSFTKAVLGGLVNIPTLTKNVSFDLPSMSHHGHVVELKNQGFPLSSYSRTKKRGSMFVKILIDIPSDLSKEEQGWIKKIHGNSSLCPNVEEFKMRVQEVLRSRNE